MGRCAALLLLASASLPGCALTRTVWRGTVTREELDTVHEVVVFPKGAVFLRYSAKRYEPYWEVGPMGNGPPEREVRLERVLLVPPSDMERFLARKGRGTIPEVTREELQKFVHSSSTLSGTPVGARVSSAIPIGEWIELSGTPVGAHVNSSREPDDVVAFAYPRSSREGHGGEPRQAEEVTVRFHLPKGPTAKPASVVVRALLTPTALIADAAADAVIIVTAPVWFPIVLSRMTHIFKGAWPPI